MGMYIEAGVGKAWAGKDVEMGRRAATEAIQQLTHFRPTLTLVFVSSELNIEEVNRGVREVVGDCTVLGTSSAGEIANEHFTHSVVVAVLASPRLRVKAGVGKDVTSDFKKAVHQALTNAGVSEYFNSEHPLHQMLHMSTSRRAGLSPVFLIVFSPGATKRQVSLSHDIHTELRKASGSRIPIFGGTSSDYFHFEANYQIMDDCVYSDAIVLAFVEAEILFGLGMAHGFSTTTKRALITKASGHVVHELDNRPAVDVCSELLGIPIEHLGDGVIWFSQFPFGTVDVYGNSLLHVPECVLPDGSIQFGPLMRNDQVLTLMRATPDDIAEAGLSSYHNAIRQGGLKKPSFAFMFSCALRRRLMGDDEWKEMDLLRSKARIPVAGFYTFGEQGMSPDGLPVYSNQSVCTLVLSDELNPISAFLHKGKRIYYEFASQLKKKEAQMKVMSRISQIIQEESDPTRLLSQLCDRLDNIFPWADWRFYLSASIAHTFYLVKMRADEGFPPQISDGKMPRGFTAIRLTSHGRRLGMLLAKEKPGAVFPYEEDMAIAKTIARLAARGLQRMEIDRRLTKKLVQLEVLNRLSHEVSKSISANTKLKNIIKHVRRILKFSMVSLWLVDPAYEFLIREVSDEDRESKLAGRYREYDEHLAKWQIANCRPTSTADLSRDDYFVKTTPPFTMAFISLPLSTKGHIVGILNVFWRTDAEHSFQHDQTKETVEFLGGVVSHLAVFIENKYLQKHTTFLKEIHHRLKNNLQNVASILRLQIRRLEGMSAEQALNDSITRIMSIAVVHETLCRGDIGMVDLRTLIGSVSGLSLAGQMEPGMTVDISGSSVMIPSREATSLALVVNELIQNAARHAYKGEAEGNLSIAIEQCAKNISITIRDDGRGLPEGFSFEKDGNLGLTIVRTLVKDDLRGRFVLNGEDGTAARITFPLPKDYYELKRS
jgi:two-component sensor histidine kinase